MFDMISSVNLWCELKKNQDGFDKNLLTKKKVSLLDRNCRRDTRGDCALAMKLSN